MKVTACATTLHVFWHVAMLKGWMDIADEQLSVMANSGLHECHAGVLGSGSDMEALICLSEAAGVDLSIDYYSDNFQEYEVPTLTALWKNAAANPEDASLYFHMKGVSFPESDSRRDRRHRMQNALIAGWRESIDAMSGFDSIGLEWQALACQSVYPGNFWIASNRWLSQLDAPIKGNREACEFWISSKPGINVVDIRR